MDTPDEVEVAQALARPVGKELAAALRKLGALPCTLSGMTHLDWASAVSLAIYAKAARGDVAACKLVVDMTTGKSAEPERKVVLRRHFLDYIKDEDKD